MRLKGVIICSIEQWQDACEIIEEECDVQSPVGDTLLGAILSELNIDIEIDINKENTNG